MYHQGKRKREADSPPGPRVIVRSNEVDTATIMDQLTGWLEYEGKTPEERMKEELITIWDDGSFRMYPQSAEVAFEFLPEDGEDGAGAAASSDDSKNSKKVDNKKANTSASTSTASATATTTSKGGVPPLSYVIDGLNCDQPGCGQRFDEDRQLMGHLRLVHSLAENRCFQQGCGQSFARISQLDQHLAQSHATLTHYTCTHCPTITTFTTHASLFGHTYLNHLEGAFRCINDATNCSYTATTRADINAHLHGHHHLIPCPLATCHRFFKQMYNLKRHVRTHAGVRPYSCGWEGCLYSSESDATVIRHIRLLHLKLPKTVKEQKARNIIAEDPRNYLRTDQKLVEEQIKAYSGSF